MAKQQQQKAGLAPSMFQKYLAPMKGAWDEGKEKAKKGGQALGTGPFFCRLVALYPKEMPIKQNGKDTGQKCLGVVAKFTVVTGQATGGSCWKVWTFKDTENKTAREYFQDFQADLVKMGLHNIDSISEADLQQAMSDLAATTPGVKINRTNDRNGYTDQNGNVRINTWIEGSVTENDLIGLGAMPRQGGPASMGGAMIEEPPEGIEEPHEPELAHIPGEVPPPAPARPAQAAAPKPAPAAPAAPAAAPARPPRTAAPAVAEPVELDVGGEAEPGLDEPGPDAEEPPLEDDNVIAVGKTVQFRNPKTKQMSIGTVQGRHSSNKGWLIRDNNNPADKFGVGDDNAELKLVS